jgi:hypothetical protein
VEAWRRRVGRKKAQKAQESDGTAEGGGLFNALRHEAGRACFRE